MSTDLVFPAPRSLAHHYFDVSCLFALLLVSCIDLILKETIDSRSEFGEDTKSAFSVMSQFDRNTLGDLSPDAL